MFKRLLLSSLLLAFSAAADARPAVWLLSGADCNICGIYDRVAEDRGYERHVTFEDTRYPIRRADKAELPAFLDEHFATQRATAAWPVQLTVAVVDNRRVLFSANIADSVDWTEGYISEQFMNPPATVSEEALHDYGFDYAGYFERKINLEYFLAQAFSEHRIDEPDLELRVSQDGGNESAVAASIWGTALQPANNGLFISTRFKQLRSLFGEQPILTTYTNGASSRRDTLVKDDSGYRFIASNVSAQFSADRAGLEKWFSAIARSTRDKHLIIHVGHSGPTGVPIWGNALPVTPPLLKETIELIGKDVTLVSGGCHSGLLAGVGQCGFYAAHPGAVATGCQDSIEAVEASDDYLKYFFIESGAAADADENGELSFSEAHWYAAARLEHHNIVYSDTDQQVDAYLDARRELLSDSITLGELAALVTQLDPEEQVAFRIMSQGLDPSTRITLNNHVDLHEQAIGVLEGMTEASSAERNAATNLSYPLNLVMLARRAVYHAQEGTFDDSTVACGRESISQFTAP